jgi:hypothetical protein
MFLSRLPLMRQVGNRAVSESTAQCEISPSQCEPFGSGRFRGRPLGTAAVPETSPRRFYSKMGRSPSRVRDDLLGNAAVSESSAAKWRLLSVDCSEMGQLPVDHPPDSSNLSRCPDFPNHPIFEISQPASPHGTPSLPLPFTPGWPPPLPRHSSPFEPVNAMLTRFPFISQPISADQCRSMPINDDQCGSMPINADQ